MVAEQYNISNLKKLRSCIAHLYLLCYVYYRYQQINDNLIISLLYYVNKLNQEANIYANEQLLKYNKQYQENIPKVTHLLRFIGQDNTENMPHNRSLRKLDFILD